MVSALNDLRQHLALLNNDADVSINVNGHQWVIPVVDMARALGAETFEGAWCFPVGTPGAVQNPPQSERNPQTRWTQSNFVGAKYKLNDVYQIHTGADWDLPGYMDIGEPLYAITHGRVVCARNVPNSTWGNVLVVRYELTDGSFFYARFAHLNKIIVQAGAFVIPGQIVGEVGNVGMPTVPHLHWDITKLNDTLLGDDPLNWPSSHLTLSAASSFIAMHYVDPAAFVYHQLVPAPPKPEKIGDWMLVNVEVANVRYTPNGEKRTTLTKNTRVRVNGDVVSGGYHWTQITECTDYPDVEGYYIALSVLKAAPNTDSVVLYPQIKTRLNVRSAPSATADIVGSLEFNVATIFKSAIVICDGYEWVQFIDGSARWCAKRSTNGKWVGLSENPT